MKFYNPIIRGFNPDPSICKVGEDYYLVTSSFEYFPGIPVYHSRDLINWEHVSNAVTRPGQLPLNTARPSGGIWAPTIRYDGKYFYITATFSESRNFIIYTDDPRGSWSDPVWTEMDGIDPSMLFDGGKMYYCANDFGSRGKESPEGISVAEMDPLTGKVIGKISRVWEGTGGGWLEGPHIYHIGDWYYLIAAEGGTGVGHTAVAARSKSVWGPYEDCPYNPILTNRNDTSKRASCCGHADLIEDGSGEWWMVHLGARTYAGGKTTLGREVFLVPVEWKNGWPAAVNGMTKLEYESPAGVEQKRDTDRKYEFADYAWEPEWLFVRNRNEENIIRGNGRLILRPSCAKLTDECGEPSFAAIRQPDFECAVETEIDFDPHEDGDEAGAAVYLTPRNIYRICKRRENGVNYVIVKKLADDFVQEIYRLEAPEGRLVFRINADRKKYEFLYSIDGGDFIEAGAASSKFLTTEAADRCFTGAVIGIYAEADKQTDSEAICYRYESHIVKP